MQRAAALQGGWQVTTGGHAGSNGRQRAAPLALRAELEKLTLSAVPATARSFSCTTSTSAAPRPANLHYETLVSPRPPIPFEIKAKRPVSATVSDDVLSASEDTPAPVEDDGYIPPPLTNQSLSLLYSFTTPPPTSSLSAFANRLALSAGRDGAARSSLAGEHLPLLEQALIHPSFWSGVASLPPTTADHRYTNFHDSALNSSAVSPTYAHNGALATLGNALLGTLTSELLLTSFPNLPTRVAKAALTMYAGPKSLAAVAAGAWGVGPSRLERRDVGRVDEGKMSRKERAYGHLVGGVGGARKKDGAVEGAAGMGLVRWNRVVSEWMCDRRREPR